MTKNRQCQAMIVIAEARWRKITMSRQRCSLRPGSRTWILSIRSPRDEGANPIVRLHEGIYAAASSMGCGVVDTASVCAVLERKRPIVSDRPTRMASRSACDRVVVGEFRFVAVRHADELKRRTSVCACAADRPQPAV
jgi:hypothetical protein